MPSEGPTLRKRTDPWYPLENRFDNDPHHGASLQTPAIHPLEIGSLTLEHNLVMAPMAGITSVPFRIQVNRGGCALAFTEMISSEALVRGSEKTLHLCAQSRHEGPVAFQIFGSDPEVLARTSRITGDLGAAVIDINMGCPVRRVCRHGAGAALMETPDKAEEILRAVRAAVRLPLMVKLRSGWDASRINAPEMAEIAEGCGVDAVTVHPRTRAQVFSGSADWSVIARVKERVRIPVIGNGDVRSPADAERMFRETGCDGIMIGRGALSRPWIFREIQAVLSGGDPPPPPSTEDLKGIILDQLAEAFALFGEGVGLRSFRKHLGWYTKGLPESTRFRREVFLITERDALHEAIDRYFEGLSVRGSEGTERPSPDDQR